MCAYSMYQLHSPFASLDFETKRHIVQELVKRIEIFPERVRIELLIPKRNKVTESVMHSGDTYGDVGHQRFYLLVAELEVPHFMGYTIDRRIPIVPRSVWRAARRYTSDSIVNSVMDATPQSDRTAILIRRC